MNRSQHATDYATDAWLLDNEEVSAVGLLGRSSTAADRLSQTLAVCHRVDTAFPSHEITTIETNISYRPEGGRVEAWMLDMSEETGVWQAKRSTTADRLARITSLCTHFDMAFESNGL